MERVLERRVRLRRRPWIGVVRRRLGLQFLIEALMLTTGGTLVGALLGAAVTVGYSLVDGQPVVVSAVGVAVGLAGGLVVGAVAGLYPAVRVLRAIDPSS